MSLDKNTKNYITITLYQSKLCRSSDNFLPYTLSIKYNDQSPLETEKITKFQKIFHEETFHFNISSTFQSNTNHTISINAYTRTLLVIKNYFAKVIIPFNILKNPNQKQWYFLKDNNDEIVLKLLLSIDSTISLHQNNSMSQITKSYRVESAHDLLNKKNLNLSLNINPYFLTQRQSANKSMVNLNYFSIFKNLTNPNQLISIAENDSSSNITISNNDSNYSDCNEYNYDDIYLSDNFYNVDLNNISINDINNAISFKVDKILEKQKNYDKSSNDIKDRDDSLGRKKNILIKENEKLLVNVKKLEKSKKNFETKIINLNQNWILFEKELYKNELRNEMNSYNKKLFLDLNSSLMMNTTDLTINNIKNNLIIEKYIKRVSKNNNNHHPNISINVDLIEEPIINSKQLKNEYLASKHLNSTNFTSIYSNESIINRHYSPPTNNIYDGRIKNKNNKNSIDLDVIYNKNGKKIINSKNEVEVDNIKLIRFKTSSSKSNLLTNTNTYINNTIINNNNNLIINNNNINNGKRKLIRNSNLNKKKK